MVERIIKPDMSEEQEIKIQTILTRGVEAVYPHSDALDAVLRSGKKLKVYCGFDPTAPSMHVGHLIQMQKLADFQRAGHEVIFLVGDFTAMIGDPTDKTSSRQRLSREQVLKNMASYKQQAARILDFDNQTNPVKVLYNSEWLNKLGMADVLDMFSRMTVQQLLAHETYKKRLEEGKPLSCIEIIYPFMQGYDSVAMQVDVEVGGKDQTFNMLWGRELVKSFLGKEKYVVAGRLLTSGGEKMGKTTGARPISFLDSPNTIFQGVMLWPDDSICSGFELCTRVPMEMVKKVGNAIYAGKNPLEFKKQLALEITRIMKGEADAQAALRAYESLVEQKSNEGENIPVIKFSIPEGRETATILDLVVAAGLASSKGQARTLVQQGGVSINGEKVENIRAEYKQGLLTVRVGKKATGIRTIEIF